VTQFTNAGPDARIDVAMQGSTRRREIGVTKAELPAHALEAFALPFMVLIVASSTFYLGNVSQMTFGFLDVALQVVAVASALGALLLVAMRVLPADSPWQLLARGSVVGLAYCVWIQSQLMAWNVGPLDGRGIEWAKWSAHMMLEGVVWLAVTGTVMLAYLKGTTRLRAVAAQVVWALGIISVAGSYFTTPARASQPLGTEGHDNLLSFHRERNVLFIVLDTFQSDYFNHIIEKYPDEVGFLDGFTYHRNTISQYPYTGLSVPGFLTTLAYRNEEPFKAYLERAYSRFNILAYYGSRGMSVDAVGVDPYPALVPSSRRMRDVVNDNAAHLGEDWATFIDYGLFRSAPTFIKPYVYNDGTWAVSRYFNADSPPDYHGVDIAFLDLIRNDSDVSSPKPTVKLLHFSIPHMPLRVDERLMHNPLLEGEEGYIRQARGALLLAKRLFDHLRYLGIYDNAEIIVASDHGSFNHGFRGFGDGASAPRSTVKQSVQASALALLLHKKPAASGPLRIDDSPLTLADLPCLLGATHMCGDLAVPLPDEGNKDRVRAFFDHAYSSDIFKGGFNSDMTEYLVKGHAFAVGSWKLGNNIYKPNSVISQRDLRSYRLGTAIRATEGGNLERYIVDGWGAQEPTHRWTIGNRANLLLYPNGGADADLVLRLRGSGYLAQGEIEHQQVDVWVNDHRLGSWTMRAVEQHEVRIPAEIVLKGEGALTVSFDIGRPAAPADFGHSGDPRKLGMSLQELSIDRAR